MKRINTKTNTSLKTTRTLWTEETYIVINADDDSICSSEFNNRVVAENWAEKMKNKNLFKVVKKASTYTIEE